MAESFWQALDDLIDTCQVVIERPKGSAHPRFPDMIYPLDYGYLDGTIAGDGDGIDVWVGSESDLYRATAVICTVDRGKRDAEIKVLLNCSLDEMRLIHQFVELNGMGCLLMARSKDVHESRV